MTDMHEGANMHMGYVHEGKLVAVTINSNTVGIKNSHDHSSSVSLGITNGRQNSRRQQNMAEY